MKLDRKQKILIPIIILAFIYIIWQAYDMFFSTPDVTPASTKVQTAQQPANIKTKVATQTLTPQITPPQQKSAAKLAASSSEQAAAYSRLMKQYQTLQSKRMLLQEEVAIAKTRQQIAQLNSQLAELGGNPTSNAAGMHAGYKLIYLDQQGGSWDATLEHNGQMVNAIPGIKLANGARILYVTSSGVVIKLNGKMKKLTFSGTVTVKNKYRYHMPKVVIAKKPKPQPTKLTPITHPKAITSIKLTPAIISHKPHIIKPQPIPQKKITLVTKANDHAATPTPELAKKPALKANYTLKSTSAQTKPTVKPLKPNYQLKPALMSNGSSKPTLKANYSLKKVKANNQASKIDLTAAPVKTSQTK